MFVSRCTYMNPTPQTSDRVAWLVLLCILSSNGLLLVRRPVSYTLFLPLCSHNTLPVHNVMMIVKEFA